MTGSTNCQFAKEKTVRSDTQHTSLTNHSMFTFPENISFYWLVRKFPVLYAHRSLKAVFTRVRTVNYIYIFKSNFFTIICTFTCMPFTWFYPFICFGQNFVYVSGSLSLSLSLSIQTPSAGMPNLGYWWNAYSFVVLRNLTEKILDFSTLFSQLSFSNQLILYFVIPMYL